MKVIELKLEFICLFIHSFIPQMFISPHYGADALLGAGEIAVNKTRHNSVRVHTSDWDNMVIMKDHTDIWKIVIHAPDYR